MLQTKKYADVIIPRGVDNMGKNQAWWAARPVSAQSPKAGTAPSPLVTDSYVICQLHLNKAGGNIATSTEKT